MGKYNAKITRIMAVLCASLALCTGCDDPVSSKPVSKGGRVVIEQTYQHGQKEYVPQFKIQKVKYEGHTYLYFINRHGYAGFAGFTHDENCQCRNVQHD